MTRYSPFFFVLITLACLFCSCTKNVEKGQQKVDSSSLEWLPGASKTIVFKSPSTITPFSLTTNTRKENYVASPNCDGHFPKETCYHYQMQQVFITGNTSNHKFSVTYALIRSINENAFYDRLEISMFENEKTFANMATIVWAENASQLAEASGYNFLYTYITLEGKTFQNVYHKIDLGGELYYNKEKGVVAFKTGDGILWVLQ